MVRWGTGYAFTARGARSAAQPHRSVRSAQSERRPRHGEGRLGAGPACAHSRVVDRRAGSASADLHDTTAFRYNVLVHGFDTSLIAGNDRGGDSFGALTFTRVLGQAWEMHGEGMWREHAAVLLGAKFTMPPASRSSASSTRRPTSRTIATSAISPLGRTPALRLFMPGRRGCANCRDGRSGTCQDRW